MIGGKAGELMITCDVCGLEFDAIGLPNRRVARECAKVEGWRWKRFFGKMFDLCGFCSDCPTMACQIREALLRQWRPPRTGEI